MALVCQPDLCIIHTVNGIHFITGIPPSFTSDGQPPEAVVVDLQGDGNKLVLQCGASGIPTPRVSWFREGSLIDPASVMANGTLAIRVTENEASREGTNYYCIATNRIGPGNSTIAALRSRNVNVSHSCELSINISLK